MSDAAEGQSGSKWLPLAGIGLTLVLSEAVYLALLQLEAVNGWRPVLTFWAEMAALFALYGIAAFLVNRYKAIQKHVFWLIIFGTFLFRVTLLPAGIPYELSPSEKLEAMRADLNGTEVAYDRFQLFDNDIWRYIWDGHVWSHGVNPYLYAPLDEKLDVLSGTTVDVEADSSVRVTVAESTDSLDVWSDIRDNVNHADITTIYPPLAQAVFRLSHAIAPGSLLMMKSTLVGCELIGIFFLVLTLRRLDLPVTSVILYAWNPLMIKVFAGSGHADSILMAALSMLAYFVVRGTRSLAAAAFGLAILAKLSPVLLVPFVVRRIGWLRTLLAVVVVFVGYIPFLGAGENLFAGFLKFAREWQFNAGAFSVVRWIGEIVSDDPANLARQTCLLLILAVVGVLAWRDDLSGGSFVRSAAIVLGAMIILSPTVMPWYLSWVLPFAVLSRQNVWIYFSVLVLVAFHIIIDTNEYAFALWFEHGIFLALAAREIWLNRQTIMAYFGFTFLSESAG